MAVNKELKKKAKRKARQKQRRRTHTSSLSREKADYLYNEATWHYEGGKYDKALLSLEKALKCTPKDEEMLRMLAHLGYKMNRPRVELKGLIGLYPLGVLEEDVLYTLCVLLIREEKYQQALKVVDDAIVRISAARIRGKKKQLENLSEMKQYCEYQLQSRKFHDLLQQQQAKPAHQPRVKPKPGPPPVAQAREAAPATVKEKAPDLPEIKVVIEVHTENFAKTLTEGNLAPVEQYELTLEGYRIRFQESFENLISLQSLRNVRYLWYQEETVRKVLKSFRGRALLADEVGLGKTIEALLVFKEYSQRGMIKSGLILTPTPLVSQWREELQSKFELDIPSTDDADYRAKGDAFWKSPFILASINLAKSKKNFALVTEREYDIVIVDEAHHLKNRNTLNWKLINGLKKRFLLLLTATPVENNLMDLYNLITLLKPGQLKTAAAFKQEFMTRGDPTDPQNRGKLKELLAQVMIRNTRAIAKLDIPLRFAQTIRVDPTPDESVFYRRVCALVQQVNETGTGNRLLLKNLLAEAGSSPQAVSLTLSRALGKRDFLPEQETEMRAISAMSRTMGDSSKNKVLLKLIRSTPGKFIVFVKYMGTLESLSDFLARHKIPHALFHGSMNNKQKDEQLGIFRAEKDILVTTEIGGEGRNLQFCHQMVNYDLPWNPMKIEQRIGRIHRIGQDKEVMIYNLCAAGSIEDLILEVLDRKINMFELVIGEIDMILGRVREEKDFSDQIYDLWVNAASEEEKGKAFDRLASRLKRAKTSYQKTKLLDEKLFGENYEL